MKSTYTFKHLDHSDALVDYFEERLGEISKFLLKDGHGQVCFSKQKSEFCVEVSINTRQRYFKAVCNDHDIYTAVDNAVMKLERQIMKTRQVHKEHKKFELSKEGQMEHLNERLEYNVRYRKAA